MTVQSEGGGNAPSPTAYKTDVAHITTQRERRRLALAEIDKAQFGWYHVRAVVVAGVGFFTDAYDVCLHPANADFVGPDGDTV